MTDNWYSPPAILAIYDRVKAAEPQMKLQLGGCLGDAAHFADGGYHVPRKYLQVHLPGDYSIQQPLDKEGDPDAASAIDLTPGNGVAGMRLMTQRLADAVEHNDPRMHVVREFAGTMTGTAPPFGLDVATKRQVGPQFDDSHLWHVHISIHRAFVNDAAALSGVADVIAGVPMEEPMTPQDKQDVEQMIADGIRAALTGQSAGEFTHKSHPAIVPADPKDGVNPRINAATSAAAEAVTLARKAKA